MHRLGDVPAGHRRELGGFVQHCVAREQCRHEHVAADEIRVVPRRDVGDDAQRLVRDALLELLFFVDVDLLVTQHARRLGDEEVDPLREPVELVLGLTDRLAHLLRERSRERVVLRDDTVAKRANRGDTLLDRRCRPRGLRRAGALVLPAHRERAVFGNLGDCRAGGGIENFHCRRVSGPPAKGSRPGLAYRR